MTNHHEFDEILSSDLDRPQLSHVSSEHKQLFAQMEENSEPYRDNSFSSDSCMIRAPSLFKNMLKNTRLEDSRVDQMADTKFDFESQVHLQA